MVIERLRKNRAPALAGEKVRWYLTRMKTRVSSKGQIVLPSELRDLDKIEPGQQFTVERLSEGEYVLRRIIAPGENLLSWLSSCPARDWFEPVPSESTEEL